MIYFNLFESLQGGRLSLGLGLLLIVFLFEESEHLLLQIEILSFPDLQLSFDGCVGILNGNLIDFLRPVLINLLLLPEE